MSNETNTRYTSSVGHAYSDEAFLDLHFRACQAEYEAMLKFVNLQAGWHVLDAGCGSGSFQPLMSQLLGANGRITALDLAPENIDIVKSRAEAGVIQCTLEADVGSVTKLPYPDHSFDAVWCAAVTQYLTDEELEHTLAEFYRVIKPGGIVAVKDIDITTIGFWPPGPHLLSHFYEAAAKSGHPRTLQMYRVNELFAWLKGAGFDNVQSKTTLVERFQPLSPANKSFLKLAYKSLYGRIQDYDLPSEDLAVWERVQDVDSPHSILDDENFYNREGHLLVLGTVPK